MESLREFAWRLAVFLLPWQTRWFAEGERIGGLPWEQGRLSIYLSWLPMIAVIVLAVMERRPTKRPDRIFSVGLALIFLASIFTSSAASTVQFFLQFGLLAAFVWSLLRLNVSREEFGAAFVLSLVPQVMWGIWQFSVQYVSASKWLGIAFQHPNFPGVSVVEHDGYRLLRAYGGFPHPNIFGGWLAAGTVASVWLAGVLRERWAVWVTILAAALFSSVLVLTFSRSAWLGAVVGLSLVAFALIRSRDWRSYGWLALIAIALAGGAVTVSQWDHVVSRSATGERLEAKSIDERSQSLADGFALFRAHPFFGVGPGSELLATAHPVTTHNVFLLALAELGAVGALGLLLFAYVFFRCYVIRVTWSAFTPLATLLPVALLDHYPWSLWPGRVLLTFVVAFLCLANHKRD